MVGSRLRRVVVGRGHRPRARGRAGGSGPAARARLAHGPPGPTPRRPPRAPSWPWSPPSGWWPRSACCPPSRSRGAQAGPGSRPGAGHRARALRRDPPRPGLGVARTADHHLHRGGRALLGAPRSLVRRPGPAHPRRDRGPAGHRRRDARGRRHRRDLVDPLDRRARPRRPPAAPADAVAAQRHRGRRPHGGRAGAQLPRHRHPDHRPRGRPRVPADATGRRATDPTAGLDLGGLPRRDGRHPDRPRARHHPGHGRRHGGAQRRAARARRPGAARVARSQQALYAEAVELDPDNRLAVVGYWHSLYREASTDEDLRAYLHLLGHALESDVVRREPTLRLRLLHTRVSVGINRASLLRAERDGSAGAAGASALKDGDLPGPPGGAGPGRAAPAGGAAGPVERRRRGVPLPPGAQRAGAHPVGARLPRGRLAAPERSVARPRGVRPRAQLRGRVPPGRDPGPGRARRTPPGVRRRRPDAGRVARPGPPAGGTAQPAAGGRSGRAADQPLPQPLRHSPAGRHARRRTVPRPRRGPADGRAGARSTG